MSDENKLTAEDLATRYELLKGCIARVDNFGFKGKKREEAALDYLCGVCHALETTKHRLAQNLLACTVMIFATRGAYSEAKRMMTEYEAEREKK